MQVNKLTFADLPVDDQKILLRWKDHVFRSDHQHYQLQLQINELQLLEATLQVGFKENFMLGIDQDQDSRSIFKKVPVTYLTVVIYKGIEDNLMDRKVITILSTTLYHTGAFSLKCIQRMFETPFMQDVETVHFWSDGGPHFRNKQLIWSLLNQEDPVLPGVSFEVNFTEPYHGKGNLTVFLVIIAQTFREICRKMEFNPFLPQHHSSARLPNTKPYILMIHLVNMKSL
ncbi:MAG: hypothetical protein EZS28_044820 [Streblomastix strix]|uniref:Uncharacterized protein n=1 Tax=Streblomastix strix TaxID=222440 RepID=A0A5J4TP78_9EUKA|nr:MAG: hypothetical protein EZS28_044820 [Streblomastix strix]